jgi:hypothetical protein
MNCQDLKRYLLAIPTGDGDASVARHTAQCAECRRFAADLARFEHVIEGAALSVTVPEGLPARVLLHDPESRFEAKRGAPDSDSSIRS